MWVTAGNVGWTAAGAALYFLARRRLLRGGVHGRNLELAACLLVSALAVAGFGLAHVGMNASWTGRAAVTDWRWLENALAFSAALLGAHVLLRLLRSRADQLVLPLAAYLALVGLVNLDVWETRDANAYVTTVALPALRQERAAIAADKTLTPARRAELLRAFGSVPNELDYERGARTATVLDAGWLARYNAAALRARAVEEERAAASPVHARVVRIGDDVRRQLVAAVLGLLSVPVVLVLFARGPPRALRERALEVAVLALPALVLVAVSTGDRELPPLVRVGGYPVTVFEVVKLGLVGVVALALTRPRGDRIGRLASAAAVLTVVPMLWRDPGAGVMLLAVAAVMASLVASRRVRAALVVAGVAVLVAAPFVVRAAGERLPTTARVRLHMWADPWGTYQQAEVGNEVRRAVTTLAGRTVAQQPSGGRALAAARVAPQPALELAHDADDIERELRWRLAALAGDDEDTSPLVPRSGSDDERVLLAAETLWSDIAGSGKARGSPNGSALLRARVDDAIAQLRSAADTAGAQLLTRRSAELAIVPDNYQLQRSLYALRKGGVLGVGLGRGRPEAVPGLTEDLALASIGESTGLAGVLVVSLLVLLLVGRGLELARRETNRVLALAVAGLAALLGLQAVVRIGGLTGLVPFTGLTFPFLSRSGTGLISSFALAAVLMAVSARTSAHTPASRRLRPLAAGGFPLVFTVVLANVALLQLTGRSVAPGPFLASLPGTTAPFLHADDQWSSPTYRRAAGPIVDRSGRALARTPSLGAARSFDDAKVAGSLGHTLLQLDLAYHDALLAPQPGSRLVGPTLVTTIAPGVQRAVAAAFVQGAAEAGLTNVEQLRGAVAVVDVKDGSIVALLSRPAFSLHELADPMAWAGAEAAERRSGFAYRYLNRAVHGLYPPGSIFKTITAAGALERGFHTLHSRDFDYDHGPEGRRAPDRIDQLGAWHQLALADGPPITDGNHPQLEHWVFDLASAFEWSCNVAFAQMGLELGAADVIGFARRFGFERPLRVPGLGTETSTLDNDSAKPVDERYLARSVSNLARTAFGQGQARVTPLQMALVPAAIANGGVIMAPHVVAGWRSSTGAWLSRYRPHPFADTGLSARTIRDLRTMMWVSVAHGWAGTARVNPNNARPGVGGKTGSAEWSETADASHAWFIGFYPTEAPRLALAIVVERGGAGPTVAGRIARRIFAAPATLRYVREVPS